MILTRFDTYEILFIANGRNAVSSFVSGTGYTDFVWKAFKYESTGSRPSDLIANKYNEESHYERNCGGNYSRLNAIDAKWCGIRHHEYSDPGIVFGVYIGSRYF